MIRLGAMLLATVLGLFVLLSSYGSGDLRAARQAANPAPPRPAAQDAGAAPILPQLLTPPEEAAVPAAPIVAVQTQTPQRVRQFPGPLLEPSPEFGGRETPVATVAPAGATGLTMYVAADRINMREGPSTNDRVVGSLVNGAAVEVLGPADAEWVNIRDADGGIGYVAGRFLAVNPN